MLSVTEVKKRFCELIECDNEAELSERLTEKILNNNIDDLFSEYLEFTGGLEHDYIMDLYSNYLAERENLHQDYTPQSLSRMLAMLALDKDEEIKTVYDCCCGSGSLTLEFWKLAPDVTFYMHELDTKVMPFLLFNLRIRGINADVINGDVLSQEIFKVYRLRKQGRFSTVEVITENYEIPICDCAISNPPFNLHFKDKKDYSKYCGYKQTAYADALFAIRCLEQIKENGKLFFIESPGMNYHNDSTWLFRKYIVDNNIFDVCIHLSAKLFVNVSITTMIWILDKDKKHDDFLFVDCERKNVHKDYFTRYKNGTFGGASHENRVYEKKYDGYDDGNILILIDAINERCSHIRDFVYSVKADAFDDKYSFSIGNDYFNKQDENAKGSFLYITGKDLYEQPMEVRINKKEIERHMQEIADRVEKKMEEWHKKYNTTP